MPLKFHLTPKRYKYSAHWYFPPIIISIWLSIYSLFNRTPIVPAVIMIFQPNLVCLSVLSAVSFVIPEFELALDPATTRLSSSSYGMTVAMEESALFSYSTSWGCATPSWEFKKQLCIPLHLTMETKWCLKVPLFVCLLCLLFTMHQSAPTNYCCVSFWMQRQRSVSWSEGHNQMRQWSDRPKGMRTTKDTKWLACNFKRRNFAWPKSVFIDWYTLNWL